MSPALIPAVCAMCAMLAAWNPLSMKHFSAASRIRSRCRAARVAAAGLAAAGASPAWGLKLFMARGPGAVLLPAATECLVQGHPIVLLREPRGYQTLLRGVVAALRVEHGQVAVAAGLITLLRQVIGTLRRRYQGFLRLALSLERQGQRQRVRHFAESGLDRLLVLRHCDIAVGARNGEIAHQLAALEQRQRRLRDETPAASAG